MPKPINGTQIRHNNIITILKAFKEKGPISKRELQDITGLSWGAVSSISSLLTSCGYITTVGKQRTVFGRKPEELDINDADHYILGVDMNISTGASSIITDLKGRIIREYPTVAIPRNYDGAIKTLFDIIDRMKSDLKEKSVLGIGIAQQGFVNAKRGVSIHFPHVKGWENVPLCEMLTERYDCFSMIMHDPNCVLTAERATGKSCSQLTENAALLRIDGGIGMAVMINGAMSEGSDGHTGEFGHITIDPNGPLCSCGKSGCLGTYSSLDGVIMRFREAAESRETVLPKDCEDIREIAAAARKGDRLSIEMFESMGWYLGLAIANFCTIFYPEVFIIYGKAISYEDLFFDSLMQAFNENIYSKRPINVCASRLDANAPALGAALAVSDRIYETVADNIETNEPL